MGGLAQQSLYLGTCTNNEAEYRALNLGLEEALRNKYVELRIFLDSELVVRQLARIYKIKNSNLAKLSKDTRRLIIVPRFVYP